MKKNEIKAKIISIILAVSPDNITSDEIFEQLTERVEPGRKQETIRSFIREIVNEGENLIGSSNRGYFYITKEGDLRRAQHSLSGRIEKLQDRINNLQNMWNEQQGND
jgi:predicted transcriptional regulator